MEDIVRQGMPEEQKRALDRVAYSLRLYVDTWLKPDGKRHRKTVIQFEGDRFKPTKIEIHFRKGGGK